MSKERRHSTSPKTPHLELTCLQQNPTTLYDFNIQESHDEKITYDIAGPMCFQGDFLAHDVELPKLERGDIIVIHDTGSYTMSMYSRYNSITPSAVYGYEKSQEGALKIRCFKERESPEETLAFWGNAYPRIVN